MAETGHTAGEYISHHLQNLTVCKADGEWVWNECHGNFFAINVDSMFFAIVLGISLGLVLQPRRQEGDDRRARPRPRPSSRSSSISWTSSVRDTFTIRPRASSSRRSR